MSRLLPSHGHNGDQRVAPLLGNGADEYTTQIGTPSTLFKERLAVIRRHLWVVVCVAALCVAFVAYRISQERPVYRAHAVIELADERRAMAGDLAGAGGQAQAMSATADPLLTQLEILQSENIAAAVVDSVGLRLQVLTPELPVRLVERVRVDGLTPVDTILIRFGDDGLEARVKEFEVAARYGEDVEIGGVQFAVTERPADLSEATLAVISDVEAIESVRAALQAVRRERTSIVDITYTADDPHLAQRVVNAAVAAFQNYDAEKAQERSRLRRQFVAQQLVRTDSALTEAQMLLAAFRSRENVYSSRAKMIAQQEAMMGLGMEREQINAERQTYQALLDQLRRPREGSASDALQSAISGPLVSRPGIGTNPMIASLYDVLVQYEMQRDTLTKRVWGARSASHPDVVLAERLVKDTEAKLINAVRSHVAVLEERIRSLESIEARSAATNQTISTTEAEEMRLVQQVEGTAKLADELRDEYQKAQISEAVELGRVDVVTPALRPGVPVGNAATRRLITALLVGIMLGGGGAFMLENLNTSIRRREDVEGILRIPNLAIIPQIAVQNGNGVASKMLPLRMGGKPLLSKARGSTSGSGLVTAEDARSSGAEAYRTLRTNLIFSQAVQNLRALVVTSTSASEGKSTTSSNLAVTFAQQGMKVLLVDCDLRKARLHKVFGVPREPGLTQALLGYNSVQEVARQTAVPGLDFLAAGTLPPNPSELVGGELMKNFLAAVKELYDVVIIDTPPLMAAADSAILGAAADGVLLVLRAGHTERAMAASALEQLHSVGARVIGAVLNDPEGKVPSYGGHYHYEYYGDEA